MPRVCTICTHDLRDEIDAAIVSGAPYRQIAERFGTSESAMYRHKNDHVSKRVAARVAKAQDAKDVADADDLLAQIKALRNRSISILQKAEHAGDYRTALQGIREARGCIELLAEMENQLNRGDTVNIIIAPQWIELRTVLLTALQGHPDALQAVAGALASIEGGDHARVA